MSFKDRWREYLRTGESQADYLSEKNTWRKFVAESFDGELETVQEPQDESEAAQVMAPSEVPGELYHATRPPLLNSIAEKGLVDNSGFSQHGSGQAGLSFATELEPLVGGSFGNLILVFSGEEMAASGQYEFRPHQDPSIDTDEQELRVTMIDSAGTSGSGIDDKVENLGTLVPFHYCRKLIFLQDIPKFERKWLQNQFPSLEIQIYKSKSSENEE